MNICQIEAETASYYIRMSDNELAYQEAYDEYVADAFDADSEFLWCEERIGNHGSFAQAVAAAIRDTKENAELGAIVRALANQAIGQMADWQASRGSK